MNLCADVVGDQTHDALTVGWRQHLSRIGQAVRQPIDPDAAIGIQHHFGDRGIIQEPGNGGSQRRA